MVPKPISYVELQRLLADPDVPDGEIRPYLRADEIRAFEPQVFADPRFVEGMPGPDATGPQPESAVLLNPVNHLDRWRRQARYRGRIHGYRGLRIVSEGDSWFQYPFLLRDVIDCLEPHYAIWCVAAAGDLLSDMVRQDEIADALGREQADVLLLSGGGNDLLGNGKLATYLNRYEPGSAPRDLVKPEFDKFLEGILELYAQLFARVAETHGHVRVICHGYDYAIPRRNGRWLGRPLQAREVPEGKIGEDLIALVIDRFNDALAETAARFRNVTYVDCRDVVGSRWHDELHPTDDGYAAVAERFRAAIG